MNDSGLYVHIPFCSSRCLYCSFYSQTDFSFISQWLESLRREAGIYKRSIGLFDSIYLGGGTPSALPQSHFQELIKTLFEIFPFKEPLEFTVEANPDDVTLNSLAFFKACGVNRLSLGIQSLQDRDLAFLGRRHSGPQAERALDLGRQAGFQSLSIDLIYGLPEQTLSDWTETLQRVMTFRPDHLSCYQLTIERHTPLGALLHQGKIRKIDLGRERQFFVITSSFLEEEGYRHYEVSNFAQQGHECRHNLKYWDGSPYLGLGPAAHSFNGTERWWNTRSVRRYIRRLSNRQAPLAGKEMLSEETRYLESLLLGFRTKQGIAVAMLKQVPALDSKLRQLEKSGLVTILGDRMVPTREGFLHADGLPLLFS